MAEKEKEIKIKPVKSVFEQNQKRDKEKKKKGKEKLQKKGVTANLVCNSKSIVVFEKKKKEGKKGKKKSKSNLNKNLQRNQITSSHSVNKIHSSYSQKKFKINKKFDHFKKTNHLVGEESSIEEFNEDDWSEILPIGIHRHNKKNQNKEKRKSKKKLQKTNPKKTQKTTKSNQHINHQKKNKFNRTKVAKNTKYSNSCITLLDIKNELKNQLESNNVQNLKSTKKSNSSMFYKDEHITRSGNVTFILKKMQRSHSVFIQSHPNEEFNDRDHLHNDNQKKTKNKKSKKKEKI
ncbi:hypothetical protein M0812_02035 [Anaeramoeba flamelloides]|uniref:Uncharacterized protein n=1 Tax=Anaeramoeba flamelloides TaxID=1746091 RepID=A0AAV7YZF8_9EUKA|nr:hypothetical protein M0812_02035 [Anaeramoeba flamelloides]